MFMITMGQGFQMTLENGWTVSVQFGTGNYGARRNANYSLAKNVDFWESQTAEIAAWYGEREDHKGISNWYRFEKDENVKGYCTANEVVAFLGMIALLPNHAMLKEFSDLEG